MTFIEYASCHVSEALPHKACAQARASPLPALANSETLVPSSRERLGKDTARIAVFKENYLLACEE